MPPKLLIITHDECGDYVVPGHPENPQRVLASLKHLRGFLPKETFLKPSKAVKEDILSVHRQVLWDTVQREEFLDPDTPGPEGIFEAALYSAGAAIDAGKAALGGRAAFSLMRPPGHHATPASGMGFCYFNSIAVAAQHLVTSSRANRVAILDLDCHHGNGTEAFCLGRPAFLYASLHQFPCYPGTGSKSSDNCLNWPLMPGTKEDLYFPALDHAMDRIRKFQPDLVGISMGFDTYELDPLTQFGLKRRDFFKIGKALQGLNLPIFGVLEGGYHDDLPLLLEEYLAGWTT